MPAIYLGEQYADGLVDDLALNGARYIADIPTFGDGLDMDDFPRSADADQHNEIVSRLVKRGVIPASRITIGYSIPEDIRRHCVQMAILAELCSVTSFDELDIDRLLALLNHPGWPSRWLVDCVYGDPFDIFRLGNTYRSETLVDIALRIYDLSTFDDLPILADALQDQGCGDTQVLEHCYSKSNHVRGCWVVDAILDKF